MTQGLDGVAIAAQVIPTLLIVLALPLKRRSRVKGSQQFVATWLRVVTFATAGIGEALAIYTLHDGIITPLRLWLIYGSIGLILGAIVIGETTYNLGVLLFSIRPSTFGRLFICALFLIGSASIWLVIGWLLSGWAQATLRLILIAALGVYVFRPYRAAKTFDTEGPLLALWEENWRKFEANAGYKSGQSARKPRDIRPVRQTVRPCRAPLRKRRVAGTRRRSQI